MKIYISGPMSGIEDHNKPAFHAEAARLRALGHEVWNPAEFPNEGKSWADCLRYDLVRLMEVDAVALLPRWGGSRGSRLEVDVARELGMLVREAEFFK